MNGFIREGGKRVAARAWPGPIRLGWSRVLELYWVETEAGRELLPQSYLKQIWEGPCGWLR